MTANLSPQASILVADDDAAIRTVLQEALMRQGYDVTVAADRAALRGMLSRQDVDVLIADILMPDGNNLDLLPDLQRAYPQVKIIVITAQNTLRMAVDVAALKLHDYLPKPFDLPALLESVARACQTPPQTVDQRTDPIDGNDPGLPMIGRSAVMQEVYRTIARVAGTDFTVLITGESGTGKELIARAIHRYGARRHKPFVALNMAAIPRDLIESELFGHEKGAFTGAINRHAGKFEQAAGGVLFLDEIGDMPLEAQTRLLRVLQDGEYSAVGSKEKQRADVRVVAATHRDLARLVHEGQFRQDLYYRLNVINIQVPPLRDRRDDIGLLTNYFLQNILGKHRHVSIDQAAQKILAAHDWPGNVRELENTIRRLAVHHTGPVITGADVIRALPSQGPVPSDAPVESSLGASIHRHLSDYFAAHQGELPPAGLYDRVLREVERPLLSLVLAATGGNQVKAAAVLGLNRNTLRKKIQELDIAPGKGVK